MYYIYTTTHLNLYSIINSLTLVVHCREIYKIYKEKGDILKYHTGFTHDFFSFFFSLT